MSSDQRLPGTWIHYCHNAEYLFFPFAETRRVREMLFEQLGVTDTNDLFATYAVLWRGTKREVEVLFENVRGLVTAVGPKGAPGEVLRSIQHDLGIKAPLADPDGWRAFLRGAASA